MSPSVRDQYHFIERGEIVAWFLPRFHDDLRDLGFFSPGFRGLGEQAPGGRGGATRVVLATGTRAVLRPYRRGGLPGRIQKDLFLSGGRALHELQLHGALASLGVPTVQVLAARTERVFGIFFRHWLLTREETACDLLEALRRWPERRRELLAEAGAAVNRLHEAGFLHPDLHPRNLLVVHGEGPRRILVIDLDRGRLRPRLTARERIGSLVRCARYAARHADAARPMGSRQNQLRFLRAYLGLGGAPLKDLHRAIAGRLRRQLLWRSLLGRRPIAGAP